MKGKIYNLQDYLKRQNVSGMLVLKNGKVAYKYLGEGNTDSTLWTSRSVGKSVVSALVGVAIKEGKSTPGRPCHPIRTGFKGTAREGVTLKQLITHTSGVAWTEDYTNAQSDFARLTECEAKPGTYDCVRTTVKGYTVNTRRAKTGPIPRVAPGC